MSLMIKYMGLRDFIDLRLPGEDAATLVFANSTDPDKFVFGRFTIDDSHYGYFTLGMVKGVYVPTYAIGNVKTSSYIDQLITIVSKDTEKIRNIIKGKVVSKTMRRTVSDLYIINMSNTVMATLNTKDPFLKEMFPILLRLLEEGNTPKVKRDMRETLTKYSPITGTCKDVGTYYDLKGLTDDNINVPTILSLVYEPVLKDVPHNALFMYCVIQYIIKSIFIDLKVSNFKKENNAKKVFRSHFKLITETLREEASDGN